MSLMWLSLKFMAATVPLVIAMTFESVLPGKSWLWGLSFYGLIVVLISLSLHSSFKGIVRRRKERSAGYTTIWKVAKYEPNLVYIDDKDGRVIAAAGDPRPATGRRADIEAAKARY